MISVPAPSNDHSAALFAYRGQVDLYITLLHGHQQLYLIAISTLLSFLANSKMVFSLLASWSFWLLTPAIPTPVYKCQYHGITGPIPVPAHPLDSHLHSELCPASLKLFWAPPTVASPMPLSLLFTSPSHLFGDSSSSLILKGWVQIHSQHPDRERRISCICWNSK